MQLALYEPDIPQNLGSILRLCACMGARLHVIEPCGFILDDKRIRRVAMDYARQADVIRHSSWEHFLAAIKQQQARLVLFTTKATQAYWDFAFSKSDILLFGRESAGVPESVAEAADARLRIPMQASARSLNIAQSAAMALGEAQRQLR